MQGFGYLEVAELATDGFVVVARQSASDLSAQMFDASGNAVGAPVELAADETLPNNAKPQDIEVAGLPGGGYVAVWHEDGIRNGVFAQVVDAQRQPHGDPILVNEYALGNPDNVSVAVLTNGSFVVTWDGNHQSGQDSEVYSRTFTLDPDLFPVPVAEQQGTLSAEKFVFAPMSIQPQSDSMEIGMIEDVANADNYIASNSSLWVFDEPIPLVSDSTFDL